MFGFLRLSRCRSQSEQHALYQAQFCGVCHAMAAEGGWFSSLLTNYDITFWMLVLSGLEGGPPVERRPCTALPFRNVGVQTISPLGRRVLVALNTALVASKLEDDRADGEGWLKGLAFRLLTGPDRRARQVLTEIGFDMARLEGLGRRQRELEATASGLTIERLLEPTRELLEEVFLTLATLTERADLKAALGRVGTGVGEFLYLWDALEDLDRDRRRGSFNAILACWGEDWSRVEVRRRLRLALQQMKTGLAELPLGERAPLAENLLGTLRSKLARALPGPGARMRGPRHRLGQAAFLKPPEARIQCDCDCGGDACCHCGECDCAGCDCHGAHCCGDGCQCGQGHCCQTDCCPASDCDCCTCEWCSCDCGACGDFPCDDLCCCCDDATAPPPSQPAAEAPPPRRRWGLKSPIGPGRRQRRPSEQPSDWSDAPTETPTGEPGRSQPTPDASPRLIEPAPGGWGSNPEHDASDLHPEDG